MEDPQHKAGVENKLRRARPVRSLILVELSIDLGAKIDGERAVIQRGTRAELGGSSNLTSELSS